MQHVGQVILLNLDKIFSSTFLFNFMQKTEQKLNHNKIKTFPENKKKFPFPNLKSQIFVQFSSDCPKLYYLAASAAAVTEWSHINCADECFIHKQEEDLAL